MLHLEEQIKATEGYGTPTELQRRLVDAEENAQGKAISNENIKRCLWFLRDNGLVVGGKNDPTIASDICHLLHSKEGFTVNVEAPEKGTDVNSKALIDSSVLNRPCPLWLLYITFKYKLRVYLFSTRAKTLVVGPQVATVTIGIVHLAVSFSSFSEYHPLTVSSTPPTDRSQSSPSAGPSFPTTPTRPQILRPAMTSAQMTTSASSSSSDPTLSSSEPMPSSSFPVPVFRKSPRPQERTKKTKLDGDLVREIFEEEW